MKSHNFYCTMSMIHPRFWNSTRSFTTHTATDLMMNHSLPLLSLKVIDNNRKGVEPLSLKGKSVLGAWGKNS